METEQQPDLFDRVLDFLSQLVMPDWAALITLIPILLIVLVVLYLLHTWWQWRRTLPRNLPRVPRRLAAGAAPPGVHLPGPSRWPFVVPIGGALVLLALAVPPRDEAGDVTMPFNLPLLAVGLLVTVLAVAGWLMDAMREWRATAGTSGQVAVITAGTRRMAGLPARTGRAALGGNASAAGVAALPSGVPLGPHGGVEAVLRAEATAVPRRRTQGEPPPGVHLPGPSPWPFFAPIGIALILFGFVLSPVLLVGGLILGFMAAAGWYLEATHEYRTTEQLGHPVPKTRDPAQAWPRRLGRVFIVVAALSVVLAFGPGWVGSLAPAAPAESAPPVSQTPELVARTAASFETQTLVVPADKPFDLVFRNENVGIPHDVAITDGPDRTTVYFDGEQITGPATITYQVPAVPAGEYYFLCTIHPPMNGTVEARPAP